MFGEGRGGVRSIPALIGGLSYSAYQTHLVEKALATRAAVIVDITVLPPHLPSGGAEYRGGNGALSCDARHLQLDENSSAT